MRRIIGLFVAAIVVSIAFSCKKDKAEEKIEEEDPCLDVVVSFSTDIAPIFQNNCAFPGCHGDASNSGFTMNNYAEISTQAQNPRLLAAIKHESGTPMPRIIPLQPEANMLADSLILKIECWINDGTPNN